MYDGNIPMNNAIGPASVPAELPLTFQQWQQQNMQGTGTRLHDKNDYMFNDPSKYLIQNGYAFDRSLAGTMGGYQDYLNTLPGQATPAFPVTQNPNLPNATGNIQSFGSNPDIEDSWIPGAVEAQQIFNQGLPELDPMGYIDQSMANLAGPNAFTNQIGNFNAPNFSMPGSASALRRTDTGNQYAGDLAGINTGNPFLDQFQGYVSQMNPYADQLYKIGADKIRDRINSQFGAAGQGDSPLNLDTQLADLGDYTAQFYGGIYGDQQQRMLDAMTRGADVYSTGVGQGINALTAAGGLQRDATGQRIDALSRHGDLALDTRGLNLAGRELGLDALKTGAGLTNQQNVNAATLIPGLLSGEQSQQWLPLQQYANIVSQLTGSSPQQTRDPGASGWDKLMGLGSLLIGAGGL